jgi:hypothetical protein
VSAVFKEDSNPERTARHGEHGDLRDAYPPFFRANRLKTKHSPQSYPTGLKRRDNGRA